MPYVTPDVTIDVDSLYDDAVAAYQETFPEWTPDETSRIAIILSAAATMAYEQAYVLSQQLDNVFVKFGEELYQIEFREPVSAEGVTTWVANDTLGHTISQGEEVVIEEQGFVVTQDVVIPEGSTSTGVGEVTISALEPGEDGNGLNGTVDAVNALSWLSSIALVGSTAGGAEGETSLDYMDRLRDELSTVAPTAITAQDYVVFARTVPGAFRAVALDGYIPGGTNTWDPLSQTYGNAGHISVSVLDEEGNEGPTADVLADLETRRLVGLQIHMISPTFTDIAVTAAVTIDTIRFDPASVLDQCQIAVESYLNAANWGRSPQSVNLREWSLDTYVRRDELYTALNNVLGVMHVDTLTINGNSSSNVTLPGVVGLPTTSGTTTITQT